MNTVVLEVRSLEDSLAEVVQALKGGRVDHEARIDKLSPNGNNEIKGRVNN